MDATLFNRLGVELTYAFCVHPDCLIAISGGAVILTQCAVGCAAIMEWLPLLRAETDCFTEIGNRLFEVSVAPCRITAQD